MLPAYSETAAGRPACHKASNSNWGQGSRRASLVLFERQCCSWPLVVQVVVIDALDEGSLWEGFTYAPLWRKAFSPLHPPTTLKALAEGVLKAHQGELPAGAALCFKGLCQPGFNALLSIPQRQ